MAATGPSPDPTPDDGSDTLAALDLGTNSFHLVIARFEGEGHQFEVVAREKVMVRLGSGSGDMRLLEDDAMDRGIAALKRCRQIAEAHHAPLSAVATSAVREADNADVFLERARTEAGVEVEVIAGIEEARLIHLGVLQAVPIYEKRSLLVDIGGGSTEILIGEGSEVVSAGSVKLGAIRLTRRFFRTEILHPASVESCRRHIRAVLAPMRREVRRHGFEVAVGSSGTISAVAAMIHAARDPKEPAPRTWNSFEFTRTEVRSVVKAILGATTLDERRRLPGLDEKRADIILAGALIIEQVMGELDVVSMLVSDYALREGVLLDARERQRGGALHHLHDLRRRNVLHLAEMMDDDPAHSAQAARLALELFDDTIPVHGLGDAERELLEAAALLANIGQFISHDKHHKHSYYVIRNSDRLTGFTDHEIELIALIARYHRKSPPKQGHPEFAALRPADRQIVSTAAGILRIAIGLDRTHAGLVEYLHAEVVAGPGSDKDDGREAGVAPPTNHLVINVVGRPDSDLSLEQYTASERRDLLEAQFGLPVVVQFELPT